MLIGILLPEYKLAHFIENSMACENATSNNLTVPLLWCKNRILWEGPEPEGFISRPMLGRRRTPLDFYFLVQRPTRCLIPSL